MKTLARTTIRNATRRLLADYIADMTQDIPDYSTTRSLPELRKKARECERRSRGWFGGHVDFETWANS